MLKSAASGLLLIFLQPSFFSTINQNIQKLCLRDHIHQFLLQVCAQKSKNQVFYFEHSIEYA